MPTALLLDVSISLARPVHGSDKTRKDLVQRGNALFLAFRHAPPYSPSRALVFLMFWL